MAREPTRVEIAEACEAIQEGWTEEEREQRAGYWRESQVLQRAKKLRGNESAAECSDHRYHDGRFHSGEW